MFDPRNVDWDSVPDASIHCDDARKWFYVEDGRVVSPPERCLDIFSKTSKVIPDWEPNTDYKPYADLTSVTIDIETTRIDNRLKDIRDVTRNMVIKSIGIQNEKGENVFIQNESESWMLRQLFFMLHKKQPDLILTFRGMFFDLPIIVERSRLLGVPCPFWIDYSRDESNFASARIAGRPWDAKFRAVHCTFGDNRKKASHVDLYMRAIAFDSFMRKFTSYTLKDIPIQMGLREEKRLDLGIDGIEECYRNNDWDTLHEYLKYDLEDTKLLANRFVPELVNAQAYFPGFTIQALATVGVGTQWQKALESHYSSEYIESLEQSPSLKYQGAITIANPGLYRDIVSYDWSGQYPSCMRQYGISSDKDPKLAMLSRLNHAVGYRMQLKYKKNPTRSEIEFVTTVKGALNGSYGALAAKIPFGDPIAAAMVTAFARARIKWAIKTLESLGGVLQLTDTDSVFLYTNRIDAHIEFPVDKVTLDKLPENASLQLLSAVAIGEELKRRIPDDAILDFDGLCKLFFVPPTKIERDFDKSYKVSSVLGKKNILNYFPETVLDTMLEECPDEQVTFDLLKKYSDYYALGFPHYDGVKKNYIKYLWNDKKRIYELKAKGKFVKRDRTILEKQFQQRYIELLSESKSLADKYYQDTLLEIYSGNYDVFKLMITRKIRKGEKTLIELGFGQEQDSVSFYEGYECKIQSGAYNIPFYVQKVKDMYAQLNAVDTSVKQLSLV